MKSDSPAASDSSDEPLDPNWQHLLNRFLDQTLDAEESAEFARRLREDPSALALCGQRIHFDATLQAALGAKDLEWEETRRIRFNPGGTGPLWSIERQQEFHIGRRRRRVRRQLLRASLVALGLLILGAAAYHFHARHRYQLRNGDFEAMDLSQSPNPESLSILYWQESFSTPQARVLELSRATQGELFAKSGRNVVALQPRAFLNQVLVDARGEPLAAHPGTRVHVTGWYHCRNAPQSRLEACLRFVASGYPLAIQYNLAVQSVDLKDGGWHPIHFDLTLPTDLWRKPDIVSGETPHPPGAIDLHGKPVTLSLDFYSESGELLVDDLALTAEEP
ncbi:hypothetical protein HNR46_000466 [Haloferula luteola]|uniref:Uncharacterized protein n=1 Tax=Haloferula luteola TaxID=595692 RepID=A0A840UWT5_9BACT|nr:hypothetical protein [Haloferula luteola]MBB5350242.1 hypothetical protein [Haloferula luteola]